MALRFAASADIGSGRQTTTKGSATNGFDRQLT
jgi:hypothetical protein